MKKYFEDRDFKIDGINNNTYDLLFEDDIYTGIDDYNYANALVTIDTYTKIKNKLDYIKYKDKLKYANRIKHNKDSNFYKYSDGNINIKFMMLSDVFDSKECKDELLSNKRYGKCFVRSLYLSNFVDGSSILTGNTNIKNKVFHSVVLKDGYVYDWTRNLIIKKDEYIKLTKFQILSEVKSENLANDFKYITGNLSISLPIYYLFRDEIINDITKNKNIFTPTDAGEEIYKILRKK